MRPDVVVRVAVVTGICVPHDAISNCVVEQLRLLDGMPHVEHVTLFAQVLTRDVTVDARVVADPWSLLTDEAIRTADLVVFHWGIAYDLFDAISVVPTASRRVAVHFHNTTPASLLSGGDLEKAERSLQQAQLLAEVPTEVWTYSEYNRRTLASWDVPAERVHHVPFSIEPPRDLVDRRRPDHVDLMTVGRFVPSKGVHFLIESLSLIDTSWRERITLHLVGNRRLSDAQYVTGLDQQIAELGLTDQVVFHDGVDDRQLWELYERSHVIVSPSLHEGLCVPIIEGYLAGCRAIGTDAGNLPFLITPPDPVVRAADAHALADGIVVVARQLEGGQLNDLGRVESLVAAYSSLATETSLRQRTGAHD